MKERPILFSAPMVRALLAGTKTQTRRAVSRGNSVLDWDGNSLAKWGGLDLSIATAFNRICPRWWRPGDRLWVKETFGLHAHLDFTDWHRGSIRGEIEDDIRERFAVAYRADHYDKDHAAWRPSIFMPRWASRITLEITDVRVQRLRDITDEDAKAEGITEAEAAYERDVYPHDSYRRAYSALWDRINGPGAWASNPWVWALTFKRVTP